MSDPTTQVPVLMTLDQVAELLHRNPAALRTAMSSGSDGFARRLRETKFKIGKRVYWRAQTISGLIDEAAGAAQLGP